MTFILYLHGETPSAWKVSERNVLPEAFWLPKSQCDELKRNPGLMGDPDLIELEIPEWLMREKGLA